MTQINPIRRISLVLIAAMAAASCAHHNQRTAVQNPQVSAPPAVPGVQNLYLLSDAESRSISPENLSGEKGMGGRVELKDGSAKVAAEKLGKGWKVNPYIIVQPGETLVMGEADGPGVINHIWMTIGSTIEYRDTILRMYWDGETEPSVESPVGDFFASGWGQGSEPLIDSAVVAVNARSGFNSFWQMPFRRSFRITMENTGDRAFPVYYQIDYSLMDVPENAAYFHAQFRMANPHAFKEPYTIVDGIRGRGHYVGTYLGHAAFSPGWWGEGEVKFYVDGDTDFPTINGTGEEDYFLGSYGFVKRDENGLPYEASYSSTYAGFYATRNHPLEEYYSNDAERRYGQYRWHIVDPVRFDSDLRVTIQCLGWEYENGTATGRYLPLEDHLASVAFWYQSEPHQPFPELPGPEELRLSPQKGVEPPQNRPDLVKLYESDDSTAEIVMLGDSITHGADWNELLPDRSVLNRGIPGDTSSDVLSRSVSVGNAKADFVFLMIGINDLRQGVGVEEIRRNIDSIVNELTGLETTRKVFVQSTLPCNADLIAVCSAGLPMIAQLNSYLEELSAQNERVRYLDLVGPLSDERRMLAREFTTDGVHLTGAGYSVWAREIERVLAADAE
jgi:lysophospholipase L1-like esterase